MDRMLMFCSSLLLLLLAEASLASSEASLASSSPDNTQSSSKSVSFLNGARAVREGEWLMLHDKMEQGDSLLKERLDTHYDLLKEQLNEGDDLLKEQLANSVAKLKERIQEGDSRLAEELKEDEDWLKSKLSQGVSRMKEELAEGEARRKEELQEQKDSFDKLKTFVDNWARKSEAAVVNLTHELSDMKSKLALSESSRHWTSDRLRTEQTELQEVKDTLLAVQDDLQKIQILQNFTEANLNQQKTRTADLTTQVQTIKEDLTQTLAAKDLNYEGQKSNTESEDSTGSTYVRWGRTVCPANASLIYSGFVAGGSHLHTGAATNHLCLVSTPELGSPAPSTRTFIYGAEYEHIHGNHDQDIPCSVCWTGRSTTIMVPATFTCPTGLMSQYTGYIMAGHHGHPAGTEYVCMDKDPEARDGGHLDHNGDLFYYVEAHCGSLPCPPYVTNKVVTCVVCSM